LLKGISLKPNKRMRELRTELRTYRIAIRVTKTEYDLLKASKTISKGIRQGILLYDKKLAIQYRCKSK
jgi:hypothetical protein